MPTEIIAKILRNSTTGECIDISHIKDRELSRYLEDKFNMHVYYYRHNLLEDGTTWIDFGLYNWFIYAKEGDFNKESWMKTVCNC